MWPHLLSAPRRGQEGVTWMGARLPAALPGHPEWSLLLNNGLTGLLGRSTQEPRGRHADPEAGGYPVLCPPGDPRSGLPATSLQVSAHPTPGHGLSGLGDGICFGFSRVSNSLKKGMLVLHPHLSALCTSHPPAPGYSPLPPPR